MDDLNELIKFAPWDHVKRSDLEAVTNGLSFETSRAAILKAWELSALHGNNKIDNDGLRESFRVFHPAFSQGYVYKTPSDFLYTASHEAGKFIVDQVLGLNHIGFVTLDGIDESLPLYHGTVLFRDLPSPQYGTLTKNDWLSYTIYTLAGARTIEIIYGSTVFKKGDLDDAVAYYQQFLKYPAVSFKLYLNDLFNADYDDLIHSDAGRDFAELDKQIQNCLLMNQASINSLSNKLLQKGSLLLSELREAAALPSIQ